MIATREANHGGTNGTAAPEPKHQKYKRELHQRLIANMDLAVIGRICPDQLRTEVRRAAEELCRQSTDLLTMGERERLVEEVLNETFGLGPLEPLMNDPTVSDIMINGPKVVYVEQISRKLVCLEVQSWTTRSTCCRLCSGLRAESAGVSTRPRRWLTPA